MINFLDSITKFDQHLAGMYEQLIPLFQNLIDETLYHLLLKKEKELIPIVQQKIQRHIEKKLSINEFIAYMQLADFQSSSSLVNLKYQKSVIMATYMLCGFANFSSIGIQIGGIGSLAPNQRKTLSEFGIKALIGGALASLLSATIAGMLIG